MSRREVIKVRTNPHELGNEVPQRSPLSGTLFTIPLAMNGIFEGIGTSMLAICIKLLYDDDLALFYSAKATAVIKKKTQGTCLLYTSRCV